jgi:hypothetical protein
MSVGRGRYHYLGRTFSPAPRPPAAGHWQGRPLKVPPCRCRGSRPGAPQCAHMPRQNGTALGRYQQASRRASAGARGSLRASVGGRGKAATRPGTVRLAVAHDGMTLIGQVPGRRGLPGLGRLPGPGRPASRPGLSSGRPQRPGRLAEPLSPVRGPVPGRPTRHGPTIQPQVAGKGHEADPEVLVLGTARRLAP